MAIITVQNLLIVAERARLYTILHNPDKIATIGETSHFRLDLVEMSTNNFFTKDEINKFTLPNGEEYQDIDSLHPTIVMDNTKNQDSGCKKKRNLQR